MSRKFPIKMQSKNTELVVEFETETTGTVIVPTSDWKAGQFSSSWVPCSDPIWKPHKKILSIKEVYNEPMAEH